MQIVSHVGQDAQQRPIVLIAAKRIPSNAAEQLQELLEYFNRELEQVAVADYVIVYCHSNAHLSFNMFSALAKVYSTLPREFRKNLKGLYIVHPTFWVRSFMTFMYPFISQKFWKKLFYVR
jgi:hypothetical protein